MLSHAPEFVEGVTNLRGKVLRVINLRKRFGLAAHQIDKNNRIIVVSTNRDAPANQRIQVEFD
jgi:purine-binding chemotaxis protein CheW